MRGPRQLIWSVAAVVAVVGLSACSDSSTAPSATTGPVATAAPAPGAALDAPAFAAALKRPGTTVVDVRTPAEFAQGHLPGAVNIDVSSPDFATAIGALDPAAPYAVYCKSGNRSAAALEAMQGAGFSAAYHLAGGITSWTSAGGAVVR